MWGHPWLKKKSLVSLPVREEVPLGVADCVLVRDEVADGVLDRVPVGLPVGLVGGRPDNAALQLNENTKILWVMMIFCRQLKPQGY